MFRVFFFQKEERKRLSCVLYLRGFKDSLAALTIAVRIFGGFFADLSSIVHDERAHTAAMQYGRGGASDAYGSGGLLQFGRYAGLFTIKVMSTVRGRSIGIRDAKTQSSPAISVSISSGRRLPPAGQRSRRSNDGHVYQYDVSSDLDFSS
jgi:hypothetical protein